jgi:anti-anti-sigma regulatory factor
MIIKLYDQFGNDIIHRETARKVTEMTSKESRRNQVIIDFNNIEFASRTFLHELISDLCDRNVVFINMNRDLERMMEIVIKNSYVRTKVASKPGCVYTLC